MKFVIFYDLAQGAMALVMQHFPAHKARLDEFHARGTCIAAGPLGDPPQGAMGIFTTREAAEEFVSGDPFVLNGAVASWRVLPWNAAFLP